jgi:hypothetical protein
LAATELHSIELSQALEADDTDSRIATWFTQDDVKYPIYCIDHNLGLTTEIPSERSFVIFFHYQQQVLGLLCDRVRKLPPEDPLFTQKLPTCMINNRSPIQALAIVDDESASVLQAQALGLYLTQQGKING